MAEAECLHQVESKRTQRNIPPVKSVTGTRSRALAENCRAQADTTHQPPIDIKPLERNMAAATVAPVKDTMAPITVVVLYETPAPPDVARMTWDSAG
jgi:hypothetical protein